MNAFKRPKIDSDELRAILILHNREKVVNNRKYLQIVGIDIQTLCVVGVVDENGKNILSGLHTYNDNIAKIKAETVIKAKFKNVETTGNINAIRIVSDIEDSWTLPISKLASRVKDSKAEEVFFHGSSLAVSQNILAKLLELIPEYMSAAWVYAHVADSEIRIYIDKNNRKHFQINLNGKSFININTHFNPDITQKAGKNFTGFVLMQCRFEREATIFEAVSLFPVVPSKEKPHRMEDFDEFLKSVQEKSEYLSLEKDFDQCLEEYALRLDHGDDMNDFLWDTQDRNEQFEETPTDIQPNTIFNIYASNIFQIEIANQKYNSPPVLSDEDEDDDIKIRLDKIR